MDVSLSPSQLNLYSSEHILVAENNSCKVQGLKQYGALAGVAQWIEGQCANKRVTGSILSQGTCLGCGPGLQLGAHEKQPHIDVFLPPLPSIKIK